jgi:UDP-N-acetylmuramyl-tripeptide synthetase
MKLSALIKNIPVIQISVPPHIADVHPFPSDFLPPETPPDKIVPDIDVTSIHYRAQTVLPGGLFVAIKGFKVDGHQFIDQAIEKGASVIISQKPLEKNAIVVMVENTRKALASMSSHFFGNPSQKMTIIGITGTNGKTTTAYLLERILSQAGFKVGVIGTINYRYADQVFNSQVTTPESLDLQRILSEMAGHGISHVVMEVSSHAIELFRIENCCFDVAVFTNLTRDHLDYHLTMEAYWACKKRFFMEHLVKGPKCKAAKAVFNCNDVKGKALFMKFPLNAISVGNSSLNTIYPEKFSMNLTGIKAKIKTPFGTFGFRSSLVGTFNIDNILAATGAAVALNLKPSDIKNGIEALESVPGRLERVPNDLGRFVYVDYAHTSDALRNVLKVLRSLSSMRLICVFGCGGDRDCGKRSMMGEVSIRFSDLTIVTSDNPRTESPLEIIEDILGGIRKADIKEYSVTELYEGFTEKGYAIIPDRKNAIYMSVRTSLPGDTILIAGKGHESYQIIGNKTVPFDDRLEAKIALTL